jgi:hypothetical protein
LLHSVQKEVTLTLDKLELKEAEQKLDWPQRAAQKLSPHPGRAVAPPHSPCAVCNLCNCTQALVQLLGP